MPSRPTASAPSTTIAIHERSTAASTWPRSSFDRPAPWRPIQKIIQVTMRDGDEREHAAEDLLRLEGQRVRAPREERADAERDGDRDADADPEPAEQVAPPELAEVGDEDADDEPGLEALAEADQVVGEHARLPGTGWVD